MIRTIISDLGNVLVRFDHMRTCNSLAKRTGLDADRIHELLFKSGLEKEYDLGRISSEAFGRRIVERLGVEIELPEIQKAWEAIFWPYPGMDELLKALKSHHQLILLSNTNPWHFDYCLKRFSFLQLFDTFVLSYKVGFRKPDSGIFEHAVKESGHAPGECLFIDDIQAYVDAAAELGIKSICFQGIDPLKSEFSAYGVRLF